MKNCDRCSSWQKKYKVLSAQMAFQIKKLEEDMAHQKITQHLAHQKEMQRLNDRLTSEKQDREIENKKWIEKYDSMAASYQERLKEKEKECEKKITQIQTEIQSRVETHQSEKQTKIQLEIEQLRGESEQYKKRLLYVKEEEKKLIEKFHSEEISKTMDKFKKEKEFIEEQKEKLVAEIKELQQKDLRNKTIEIQLSEQLHYQKQQAEAFKEKISQLEQTVKLCYGELHTKEKVLEYVRKEYNDRAKKLEKDYETQKEDLMRQNKKDVENLLEGQLQKCTLYENKLLELEQKREKEVRLYQAQLEQVRALVDENRCPPKYYNQINTLHSKLKHKDNEIKRVKADIKLYQLEIQNNDEMLTKFFLNPAMINTTPDIREKKPKEYKIKNNRGSLTGSNCRSPSQLKEKTPLDHDMPYNQFNTTSLDNLDFMSSSKTTKIL